MNACECLFNFMEKSHIIAYKIRVKINDILGKDQLVLEVEYP